MIRDMIALLMGVSGILAPSYSSGGESYLQVDYGATTYDANGPADSFYAEGQSFQDEVGSAALTGGYAVTRWLSMELSYTDHGRAEGTFQLNPDLRFIVQPHQYQEIEVSDFSFRSRITTPAWQGLRVQGLVGYSRADIESRMARSSFGPTRDGRVADFEPGSTSGNLYGLELEYTPSGRLHLNLSWETRDYGDIRLRRTSLGLGLQY